MSRNKMNEENNDFTQTQIMVNVIRLIYLFSVDVLCCAVPVVEASGSSPWPDPPHSASHQCCACWHESGAHFPVRTSS